MRALSEKYSLLRTYLSINKLLIMPCCSSRAQMFGKVDVRSFFWNCVCMYVSFKEKVIKIIAKLAFFFSYSLSRLLLFMAIWFPTMELDIICAMKQFPFRVNLDHPEKSPHFLRCTIACSTTAKWCLQALTHHILWTLSRMTSGCF